MKRTKIREYLKQKKKDQQLEAVNFLINSPELALRLQLDNLVLTYGYEAVVTFLTNTSQEVVDGSN